MSATEPGLPLFADGRRHALHTVALCGERATFPDRAEAEDCPACTSILEAMPKDGTCSDVPDLLRQAKADALVDFALRHVGHQSPGRMAEDLLEHAAAIREGRQS